MQGSPLIDLQGPIAIELTHRVAHVLMPDDVPPVEADLYERWAGLKVT